MRFTIKDGLLAIAAAIMVCLAFMAAGVMLVSAGLLIVGLACIGLLAFDLIRRVRRHGGDPAT